MRQFNLVSRRTRTRFLSIASSALFLATCCLATAAFGQQILPTHHTWPATADGSAKFISHFSSPQTMKLNFVLQVRDDADLDAFIAQVTDPSSPNYRQYVSVAQFADRFGATQQAYNAVISFAKANGLTVTGTSPNRMVVDVQGSVAAVEKALNVNIGLYQHPTENRTFFAPDREPTPNLSTPLWHITGLDNFSTPHPANLIHNPLAQPNITGSGPGGQFIGSDMRAAYYGGTKLTGAGQSVGLLEYVGYNPADVTNYFNKVNQPLNVTVTPVSTDGSPAICKSCDDGEQALDIEVAISMAPGMDQVLVYVSNTSDISMLNRMASDNLAKNLSSSWSWRPPDPKSADPIFKEFVAQGQTFFDASGDDGSYNGQTIFSYPADDPYVTAVGGTDLVTNGPGGSWKSETAWRYSGGGISPAKLPIPPFQQLPGVVTTANGGSLTYRNIPDVAMEANTDNYICYDGICGGNNGGTSFAAPRWAGYFALVNQQAAALGEQPVGYFNPKLYRLGLSAYYGTGFHDITSGTNGGFHAVTGYDLVTGWGSPNGQGLINLLAH